MGLRTYIGVLLAAAMYVFHGTYASADTRQTPKRLVELSEQCRNYVRDILLQTTTAAQKEAAVQGLKGLKSEFFQLMEHVKREEFAKQLSAEQLENIHACRTNLERQ